MDAEAQAALRRAREAVREAWRKTDEGKEHAKRNKAQQGSKEGRGGFVSDLLNVLA